MKDFKASKVVFKLPEKLEPNTSYWVRSGEGFNLYLSDVTGSVAYKPNVTSSQLADTLPIGKGGTGATTLTAAQTALGIDKVVSANTRWHTAKQTFPNVYVDSNGQLQKTQLATWIDHAKMYNGLVPNGSFQMGDATGWKLETSGLLTRDTSDFPFGAQACLRCADGNPLVLKLDKMPVNPYMKYRLSAMFKYEKVNSASYFYSGMVSYDVDGNEIVFSNSYHYGNTLTTLAQDLKLGDTKVYLTSLSGWQYSVMGYPRGFKFYNYVDSRGYLYDPSTMPYSRYVAFDDGVNGWWDALAGSFNASDNSITLRKAWNYANPKNANGTWTAGTKVAQATTGPLYQYILKEKWMLNQSGTTEWGYQAQELAGINRTGADINAMFRAGTASIAPIFLFNYGGTSTGDATKISNLYFEKI